MCLRGQARAPAAGHRAGLQDCRMLAEDARAAGSPLQHRWRWHCDDDRSAFDAGVGPDRVVGSAGSRAGTAAASQ